MKINQDEPFWFTEPCDQPDRRRRLHGGGGGGGDGGAADRKAGEDARVAQGIQRVNDAFGIYDEGDDEGSGSSLWGGLPGIMGQALTAAEDRRRGIGGGGEGGMSRRDRAAQTMAGREALYSTIGEDARNTGLFDLNKDRGLIERDTGFGLARTGLAGGSRDIDLNRDILDTYQQGVLRASDRALGVSNSARAADDRTRVGLINSIRSGLDEGSAQQQAYESMRNNSRQAQDEAKSNNLTGFFNSLRDTQKQYQYNQGINEAKRLYSPKRNENDSGELS